MSLGVSLVAGFVTALATAGLLVLTKDFHGGLSMDSHEGVQKLHKTPTPRIGGLSLLTGGLVGGAFLAPEAAGLWWMLCLAALPAFLSGLLEDVTKRVGIKARLLATILSGILFAWWTGYSINRVDIPGLDHVLAYGPVAVLFTGFAVGGIANAVNIIDGVNGLASGTAIIILSGLALTAGQTGDTAIMAASLLTAAAVGGFFFLNFPSGRIFFGDAGAYTTGFILAALSVALPARNPELSPLIGLLALAYPVTETMVSIWRRLNREGAHPGQPDRLHLHSLIYRSRARQLARTLGLPRMRNAMTAVILWVMPLLSVAVMVAGRESSGAMILGVALVALVYLRLYRRVALLMPRRAEKKAPEPVQV